MNIFFSFLSFIKAKKLQKKIDKGKYKYKFIYYIIIQNI